MQGFKFSILIFYFLFLFLVYNFLSFKLFSKVNIIQIFFHNNQCQISEKNVCIIASNSLDSRKSLILYFLLGCLVMNQTFSFGWWLLITSSHLPRAASPADLSQKAKHQLRALRAATWTFAMTSYVKARSSRYDLLIVHVLKVS